MNMFAITYREGASGPTTIKAEKLDSENNLLQFWNWKESGDGWLLVAAIPIDAVASVALCNDDPDDANREEA